MGKFAEKVQRPFKCVSWFVGGLCGNVKQWLLHTMGNVRVYDKPFWFVLNPKGYQIRARQIRKALAVLKTGDVVVRKYNTYLSSFFIPGRFSHSGVYVGNINVNGEFCPDVVVHALGSGVQMQDAMDFFMTCDEFAILRPKEKVSEGIGMTQVEVAGLACEIAKSYIGTPYDYDFLIAHEYGNKEEVQKRTKSVYCHELTRSCYPDLDVEPECPQLWNGMIRSNKKQFLASCFFNSDDFTVVYDSFFSEMH